MAEALSLEGRKGEALEQVEKALEIAPMFRQARRKRALVLADMGQVEEAKAILRKLTESYRDESLSPYRLGRIFIETGREREAVDYLRISVYRSPDFAPAWSLLSVALAHPRVMELEKAGEALDRALFLNPLFPGRNCLRESEN